MFWNFSEQVSYGESLNNSNIWTVKSKPSSKLVEIVVEVVEAVVAVAVVIVASWSSSDVASESRRLSLNIFDDKTHYCDWLEKLMEKHRQDIEN